MFPISIFEKQRTNSIGKSFNLPLGTDLNQIELRREDQFKEIRSNLRHKSSKILLREFSRIYCFFCGEIAEHVLPAFLHNYSGVNLWMYQDWRCSFVLCKACNAHSGKESVNYLRGFKEISPSNPFKLLSFEPDIVIPTIEPVHLHFDYSHEGLLKAKTVRAEKTINRFGLNRRELIQRRIRVMEQSDTFPDSETYSDIEGYLEGIANPIDLFFNKRIDFQSAIEYIGTSSSIYAIPNTRIFKGVKYKNISFVSINAVDEFARLHNRPEHAGIQKITIEGIRGFDEKQTLRFNGKDSIILLGENGVGKSTILEILLNILRDRSHLKFRELADNTEIEPNITVEYVDQNQFNVSAFRKSGVRYTYSVVHIKESRLSKGKIEKLSSFLSGIHRYPLAFESTARKLKILLDIEQEFELHAENGLVFWQVPNQLHTRSYLTDLSSGYRSILNIFYEIYKNTALPLFNSGAQTGFPNVVLIDEIELHLHPKFKKDIIKNLQDSFPGVLFVITTHDPLVLSSAEDNVTVVSLTKVNRRTIVDQDLPDHRELSTEQILTSPIFGLKAITSDSSTTDIFNKYYEALRNNDKESLPEFRRKLALTGHFGTSFREYLALSAIDSYFAKNEVPIIDDIELIIEQLDTNNEEN